MFSSFAGAMLLVAAADPGLTSSFDEPDRWQRVASTSSGSVWYVDRPTLRTSGRVTSAWVTMDHSRDRREAARQSRALIEIECSAGSYHWVQYFSYRRNGSPLPERVQPNVEMEIAPGSPIDDVRRGICGG